MNRKQFVIPPIALKVSHFAKICLINIFAIINPANIYEDVADKKNTSFLLNLGSLLPKSDLKFSYFINNIKYEN
jgi:hypothetical protein